MIVRDVTLRGGNTPSSIWPRWETEREEERVKKNLTYQQLNPMPRPMPFQATFWKEAKHMPAAAQLTEVKGFITLLPIRWTEGENNKIPYHNALVTQREKSPLEAQGTDRSYAEVKPDSESTGDAT